VRDFARRFAAATPPMRHNWNFARRRRISMDLARSLAQLDDAALAEFFSNDALAQARNYVARVSDIERNGASLRARVQDSAIAPHRVSARLEMREYFGAPALEITTRCNCAVGNRCKHAAALLMAVRKRGVPGDQPRSEVLQWAAGLRKRLQATQAADGGTSRARDALFYIIAPGDDGNGARLLLLKGRPDENGRPQADCTPWGAIDQALAKPPSFANESDLDVLRAIKRHRRRGEHYGEIDLDGASGAALIEAVLASGRTWTGLGSDDIAARRLAPLRRGAARPGRLVWRNLAAGLAPAIMTDPPCSMVLATDPPYCLDVPRGEIARADVASSAAVLEVLRLTRSGKRSRLGALLRRYRRHADPRRLADRLPARLPPPRAGGGRLVCRTGRERRRLARPVARHRRGRAPVRPGAAAACAVQARRALARSGRTRPHARRRRDRTADAEGERIVVPAGRIKPLARTLVDLFDSPMSGALRVSRMDAPRLTDALDEAWSRAGFQSLEKWVERLRGMQGMAPVAEPEGFGITLRPYQREGLAWLQHLRAHDLGGILADDMGLGKTAQTLAHLLTEKQAGRLDRPALVVLPTSLVFNWQREAERFAPQLRVLKLHGEPRELFERIPQHDVCLTTYPLLWRDHEKLAAHDYHLLILDEAQTVKNTGSQAAKAVRLLRARHRLCLTGTPMENHLGELWAQFDFLLPGFLGESKDFTRALAHADRKARRPDPPRTAGASRRPFILRRRKDDVATELPPKTEVVRSIELGGRQRDLYERCASRWTSGCAKKSPRGFARSRIVILDALLKLRQVCCDPRLLKTDAALR
jgi:hypothetical protein